MSVTCGFYDSLNGDRKYYASQMSQIFDGIINDGIFASIGTSFSVHEKEGNTVTVGVGKAWFNHTWTYNDSVLPLTAPESDLLLNRIDAIVIDVNASETVRKNDIIFIEGIPSAEPVKPVLTKDESAKHYQYPICYVYRAAGSNEIKEADITNSVGTTESPFITGILETVDIEELYFKWDEQIASLLDRLEKALGGITDKSGIMLKTVYDPSDQGINITTQLYTCAKSGTVFSLSGKGSNIKFVADASFEDGDTFAVNGTAVTAQTQDGEPLSGGFFASGSVVSCFLNGTVLNFKSGGGNMLNFHVVGGTTQPASPKEGTVWVNTAAEITGYEFSITRPTGVQGLVWIKMGQYSRTPFNALKKNSLYAYPLSAMQYVQGNWTAKTARIYQHGAWKDFIPQDIIIVPNIAEFPSSAWQLGSGASVGASAFTVNTTSSIPIYSWLRTPIDLGDYRTLHVACTFTNANVCQVGVCNSIGNTSMLASASQAMSSGTLSVDLSKLSGIGYLCIFPYVSGGSTVTRTFTATSIKFLP